MFYCNPCGVARGLPETLYKSRGLCEICECMAVCNERPAADLPIASISVIDDTSFWW